MSADLLAIFTGEARETLHALSTLLLHLEAEAAGPGRDEAVRTAFRHAHSLKGAAGAVERRDFVDLAHALETALDTVRKSGRAPDRGLVDAALAAVDLLQGAIEQPLQPGPAQEAARRLAAAVAQGDVAAAAAGSGGAAPVSATGTATERIGAWMKLLGSAARDADGAGAAEIAAGELVVQLERAGATGSAPLVNRTRELLGQAAAGHVPLGPVVEAALMVADFAFSEVAGGSSEEERRAVEACLAAAAPLAQRATAPVAAFTPSATPAIKERGDGTTLRVPVELMDRFLFRLDELAASRLRFDYQRRQIEELQHALESGRDGSPEEQLEQTRRRLELLRSEVAREVHSLGLLTHSLQEDVKEVRLVPIGPLLEPYPRMVRDLAHALGKEALLSLGGLDVRVDRRLLERIREALLHLLRNAVDHGVEDPQTRLGRGKPRMGRLSLTAEAREGRLFLHLEDDGGGIDPAAVRRAAERLGLVEPDQELSDHDAQWLIFRPGFTTAPRVTETSGRGVGLDAVRASMEVLGGSIDLESQVGVGTRFTLSLPLALASARGLFVTAGGQRYALPLSAVEEVVPLASDSLKAVNGRITLLRRDRALTFAPLAELLGSAGEQREDVRRAAILAIAERRLALGVEEVLGQEEAVVKALAEGTPTLEFVAGATTLPDGSLVTMLEPQALFDAAGDGAPVLSSAMAASASSGPAGKKERRVRTVLLVDDSLTTRTLVAGVLEKAGYRTLTAADGAQGLDVLRAQQVDLLVSDVEMPVLDGMTLVRRVRAAQATANLPVVLLTSLGSAQDRAMGADVGADAYVVKRDFDPAAFLTLIESLMPAEAKA